MMTITWSVSSLTAYPTEAGETNVVFSVGWCCTATDGTFTNAVPGSSGVTWQAGTPFTPYDQLTEQQVLGWVFSALGDEKATVEGYAVKGVEDQENPPVVTPPLPWAPPPVPDAPAAPVDAPAAPVADAPVAPAPSNE